MAVFMVCSMNDINPGVAILLEEMGKFPSIVAVDSVKNLAGFTVGAFVYACCTHIPHLDTHVGCPPWMYMHVKFVSPHLFAGSHPGHVPSW